MLVQQTIQSLTKESYIRTVVLFVGDPNRRAWRRERNPLLNELQLLCNRLVGPLARLALATRLYRYAIASGPNLVTRTSYLSPSFIDNIFATENRTHDFGWGKTEWTVETQF